MNKDFKEARKEYEKIVAPKTLRNNVEKIIKNTRTKKKNVVKYVPVSVAVMLLGFIITLNTNESFAKSVSNIKGFEKIVQVLTLKKYELSDEYHMANVETPQITGLEDKTFESRLNEEFMENAEVIIDAFKNDIEEMKKAGVDGHLGVDYGYDVITDSEEILVLDVYIVNTVGSSYTQHKFYNIDKINNKIITLKEWVKDENYIEKINQYIIKEMEKREEETGYEYFWNDELEFKTITENTKFYINSAGNAVISFEKYEVAPGAYGNVEFEIPSNIF